jgi:transposase
MISPERRAEIRRLFYAEHWKIGTIAAELGLHHDTVRAAVDTDSFVRPGLVRPSALDPYHTLIVETLTRHPGLRTTRLHEMLRIRGYRGSVVQLRRVVARLRPRPAPEAFLRLTTLPGEEGQVDWGHFGHLTIGRARRPVMGFVMVLSHARATHAEFFLDQSMESFLLGHVRAFDAFGGVPRRLLYDNLKSAVLERSGQIVRFNPRLLEFAGHYHFMARPCAPARGNEKGRVERRIRYLRDSFFAARTFVDIADLQRQFIVWRDDIAHQRSHPDDKSRTVADMLNDERRLLVPLPEHPFDTSHVVAVQVEKQPYVRFDGNRYSVPHQLVRKSVTLVATFELIRVLDGPNEMARHGRSWSKGEVIEDPRHVEALWDRKHAANVHRGRSRLLALIPRAAELLKALADRNEPLAAQVKALNRLLDEHGTEAVRSAVDEAIDRQTPRATSIAHLIAVDKRESTRRPHFSLTLPDRSDIRDLRVIPHALETYDDLTKTTDSDR